MLGEVSWGSGSRNTPMSAVVTDPNDNRSFGGLAVGRNCMIAVYLPKGMLV